MFPKVCLGPLWSVISKHGKDSMSSVKMHNLFPNAFSLFLSLLLLDVQQGLLSNHRKF